MKAIEEILYGIPKDICDYNEVCIEMLKGELPQYDYIGVKIAMGVATKEEYAEEIAYTETLRNKIRELECQIKGSSKTPNCVDVTE